MSIPQSWTMDNSYCVAGATEEYVEGCGWRSKRNGCLIVGSQEECREYINSIKAKSDRVRFVGAPVIKKWVGRD